MTGNKRDLVVTVIDRAMALLESAEQMLPGSASDISIHKLKARVHIANSYIALADVAHRTRTDYK